MWLMFSVKSISYKKPFYVYKTIALPQPLFPYKIYDIHREHLN